MITPENARGLSPAEMQRVQQNFADRCRKMLEEMASHARCVCGAKELSEFAHAPICPVNVTLRAARAISMLAEP